MDAFRYYLALAVLALGAPVLPYWFLVHPFVRLWRRVGEAWAYGLLGAVVLVGGAVIVSLRAVLLKAEFGTNWGLAAVGLLLVGVSAGLRLALRRSLSLPTLVGLPELSPARYPGRLLTGGIYARLRHPRYVQLTLAFLGYALIANYLALYVLAAAWAAAVGVIVVLEERELRDRFGAEYEEYCRRVPPFVPRRRRSP